MKHLPSSQTFDDTREYIIVVCCSVCGFYDWNFARPMSEHIYRCCYRLPNLVAFVIRRTHPGSFLYDVSMKSLDPIGHPERRIASKMSVNLSPNPITDFPEQFIEL